MKTRRFYNHKDPPFGMKHELMSADPLPVVKIEGSKSCRAKGSRHERPQAH